MSNRRVGSSPVSRTRIRSPMGRPLYARVVELADSLDSGSSVLYGRAGSSPASRTKKRGTRTACPSLFGALIYPYDLAYMMGTY